jgi:hypothetical protein
MSFSAQGGALIVPSLTDPALCASSEAELRTFAVFRPFLSCTITTALAWSNPRGALQGFIDSPAAPVTDPIAPYLI